MPYPVNARKEHVKAENEQTLAPWLRALGVAVFFAATLMSAACSRQAAPPVEAAAAVSVRAVRLEPQPLEEYLEITGSLVSPAAVDIKTKVAGRVMRLLKEEGQPVRAGELLAQMEETDARLALDQARANLDVAAAALERARVGEAHARAERQRAEHLKQSGGITDRDYDAAENAARDAAAQVKLAEAQVEQARRAVAIADRYLEDCRLVSPAAGEIERKYLTPGNYVDGMTLVYRVVDNRRLELEAFVASAEVARVERGQEIRFGVQSFPGEEFEARIRAISAAVQPNSRTLMIRAEVPNPTGRLKVGLFVEGRLLTGVKPGAFVVPASAVWRRVGQPPFVFVVEGDMARRRDVKLGIENTERIEIVEGLATGETVLAEQTLELADGVRVAPRL